MGDTFETMMREVNRWAYDKPTAGADQKIECAFAFICNEIDKVNKRISSLVEQRDIMDWSIYRVIIWNVQNVVKIQNGVRQQTGFAVSAVPVVIPR